MNSKPDSMRSKVRAIMAANTDPLGNTFAQLVAMAGIDSTQMSRVTHSLRHTGHLHMIVRGRHTRYFDSPEKRDAAAPAVNALVDAITKKARADKARRYWDKICAANPKPPKPKRTPKEATPIEPKKARAPKPQKASLPANVSIKRQTLDRFKDQPAIIPPHVHVQVCPSGIDMRFTFVPPKGWTGQISADWMAERQCNNQGRKA